jgi:hypothetical protein
MGKIFRNFTQGKMNKSVDERLLPDGQYIDALNVRLGNTELTDVGALENSLGNSKMVTIDYDGTALSSEAVCIGAYGDEANETIYWFVHDPNQPTSPTNKVDLIVSFNVNTNALTYLAVSDNSQNAGQTALNFNPTYLIHAIDFIDNKLLFFTDNYNPPRVINVTTPYGYPFGGPANNDEELILVIKRPPLLAPTFTLSRNISKTDYIENKFVSFAYRYKYANNEYSALSPFSDIAFTPNPFRLNVDNFTNDGMLNFYNIANVSINSGPSEVIGFDLCFKYADDNFIRIIEKFDKEDDGILDNITFNFEFDNSKVYSILPDREILRTYDNVPKLALAQTIMGNRVMYGNYTEGYDMIDKDGLPYNCAFTLALNQEAVSIEEAPDTFANNLINVNLIPTNTPKPVIFGRRCFDFSGVEDMLKIGTKITFELEFEHQSWWGETNTSINPPGTAPTGSGAGSFSISWEYTVDADYYLFNKPTFEMGNSIAFQSALGVDQTNGSGATQVKDPANCSLGSTASDLFNCSIPDPPGYTKLYSGNSGQGQAIVLYNQSTGTLEDQICFGTIAMAWFENTVGAGTPAIAEYFSITGGTVTLISSGSTKTLHSHRNYEVAIEYLDSFGRSSTALVSDNNGIFVPCAASVTKNSITATIPLQQKAPVWADKYRFLIKPDKDIYQTIYTTFWYEEPGEAATWFLLQGENEAKVQAGTTLRIKSDVDGPLTSCVDAQVLDKRVLERDWAGVGTQPPGVYMKLKPGANFNADNSTTVTYTDGVIKFDSGDTGGPSGGPIGNGTGNQEDFLFLEYPLTSSLTGNNNFPVPSGSVVNILIDIERENANGCGGSCGAKRALVDEVVIATQDYDDFKAFWDNEGLGVLFNNSPDQTVECADDSNPPSGIANYYSTLSNTAIGQPTEFAQFDLCKLQFIGTAGPSGQMRMRIVGGYSKCGTLVNRGKRNKIKAEIRVVTNVDVITFETLPADANQDIFYEGFDTYDIDADGNHLGIAANGDTDQDIAGGTEGVINLSFYDCYTFGNGVESYRIQDALAGQYFLLGQRSNAVSNESFREIHRFADITYSGTYNNEANTNRLNEFNLGLANFKPLEQSFGPIQILDARETDVLTLQEDKISYVLQGKNLLSDSTGGGAITSVPEVLGTQISRIEKYGISANPESYIQWGFEKFFTDAKRGAVLSLKGSGQGEQLSVISEFGMESWFRDLFQDSFFTQKLGGYDPYMDEYVLHSNDVALPSSEACIKCGGSRSVTINPGVPYTFCVELGAAANFTLGTASVNWTRQGLAPGASFDVDIVYDGTTTSSTGNTASGSLSYAVDNLGVRKAQVTVTAVDGWAELLLNPTCVSSEEITIKVITINDTSSVSERITTQFGWNSGTLYSPVYSENVTLLSGTPVIVSQFDVLTGFQGNGYFPINDGTNTSNVNLTADVGGTNNYPFDIANDNMAYLWTNVDHANTPAGILAILNDPNYTPIVPTGGPTIFTATFAMPPQTAANEDFLYLVFDLRKATAIDLCYDGVVYDACCDCQTALNCTAFTMGTVNADEPTGVCGDLTTQTLYHNGTGTYPQVGDYIFSQGDCVTPFSGRGWYRLNPPTGLEVIFIETTPAGLVSLRQLAC